MKLLLYVAFDDFEIKTRYQNVWIDENKIDGFYMAETGEDGIVCINLLVSGTVLSVVKNPDLVQFLDNKFKVNGKVKA